MQKDILVSVVVPVYNTAKYVEETIESIINQTLINETEIIIVNDGSTDNSLKILNSIKHKHQLLNIKLINQENGGLSNARNNGAKIASGEFIVFIDSDDKIHEKFLEKCIEVFKKNHHFQIVYSEASLFDASNGKWKLPKFELKSFLIANVIPAFAMLKRSTFISLNGYDENLKFKEDWELWIRYNKVYPNCVYRIPEVLFYYRKRKDNTSMVNKSILNTVNEEAIIYIYRKHYSYFHLNQMGFEKLFNSFKYREKYYNLWYKKLFYLIFKKRNPQ